MVSVSGIRARIVAGAFPFSRPAATFTGRHCSLFGHRATGPNEWTATRHFQWRAWRWS